MDNSRICIHCGKEVAPDRKQRCNHCGEWFYDPDEPMVNTTAPTGAVALTAKSRRGLVVGLFIALVVPVSYWVLAVLVENGVAPYHQTHARLGMLGPVALSEIVLGPLGIGIAGWSGGLRGATLLALVVLALPVLAVVWFFAVVTLSGALGEPF